MNKISKILIALNVIIIIMFGLYFFNNIVYGDLYVAEETEKKQTDTETKKLEWNGLFSDADEFLNKGDTNNSDLDETYLKKQFSSIYNLLLTIGTALTVIVGGILGIKFMMASVEEKAKIKELMIPYVLGCVVIFGAFGIWKLTVEIGNGMGSSTVQQRQEQELEQTRKNNKEKVDNIGNGNTNVSELSDDEIKSLYRSNSIDSDLNEKVNGTRNKNKVSLTQAISELSSEKKKIYQEAKNRNLLKKDEAGNEIWLE